MKKITATALTLLSLTALSLGTVTPAHAGSDKVSICHSVTPDRSELISVDKSSIVKAGHSKHDGDIIPAFSWVEDGKRLYFDGVNADKTFLIDRGCVSPQPVHTFTVMAHAPVYHAATCNDPSKPFGSVSIPNDLGLYVKTSTTPVLSEDGTQWTVAYTKEADTAGLKFVWAESNPGTFTFPVVPLSADPNYVVDSRTNVGACELPATGAGNIGTAALVTAAVLLFLGMLALLANVILRRRMV